MPKVLLLQFDTDPDCAARRDILNDLAGINSRDYTLVEDEPRWPTFFETVTRERPDIIVIACSRIPSHAVEAARYLGEGFNTRDIPVVLVDVDPKDLGEITAYIQKYHRNATIVNRAQLRDAVARSYSRSPM